MTPRTEREIIAEAYSDEAAKTWKAPVQGYPGGIPWSVHLVAYEAYCAKYSEQTAIIDLKGRYCRGGFSVRELDGFVPGWRERINYFGRLQKQVDNAERFAEALGDRFDDNVGPALQQSMCCSGQDCGCQGLTIGQYLAYQLREMIK